MIGDRAAPGELGPPPIGIKQPPMAADGSFKPALPGLVIRLDEIDPIVLALGAVEHLVHGKRLVHRRRQGAFTHAARARPAEFPHEYILVRKGGGHPLANGIDVLGRIPCRNRKVLPIGQDVDGHEIDGGGDVAMA